MNSSTTNNTNLETNNNEDKKIQCPQCPKKFSNKSNLKTHITSIHKKIFDYECPFEGCFKKFSNNSRLKTHITNCKKRFNEKNNSTNHIKKKHEILQTNENNYKCKICKEDFLNENELKMHEEVCQKNFVIN